MSDIRGLTSMLDITHKALDWQKTYRRSGGSGEMVFSPDSQTQ